MLCACGKEANQLLDCHTSVWPYLCVLGPSACCLSQIGMCGRLRSRLEQWAWEVLSATPLDSRAGKGFPVQGPSSIGAQMVGKCVSPQPQSRAVNRSLQRPLVPASQETKLALFRCLQFRRWGGICSSSLCPRSPPQAGLWPERPTPCEPECSCVWLGMYAFPCVKSLFFLTSGLFHLL